MYQKIDEITNETPVSFLTVGQLISVLNKSEKREQSTTKKTMPEIFGLETVCELTGYREATIYSKTSKNEIPHFKRGNRILFRRDDILNWLTENPVATIQESCSNLDEKLTKKSRRVGI